MDYDYLFKILLVGDSGVGKSSILLRYTDNEYKPEYISTIGVDFKIKTIVDCDKTIKLQLWDTAGQERFQTITSSYYRGAHGIVIVYDITCKESFENVKMWLKQIDNYANQKVLKILVGNKADLENSRRVDKEKVLYFCQENNIYHIETSAKNSDKIKDIFLYLSENLRKKTIQLEKQNIKISKGHKISPKDNCC